MKNNLKLLVDTFIQSVIKVIILTLIMGLPYYVMVICGESMNMNWYFPAVATTYVCILSISTAFRGEDEEH